MGSNDGLGLSGTISILPFNADAVLYCRVVPPVLCTAAIWSDGASDWVDVANITFSKSTNAIELSASLSLLGLVYGKTDIRICAGFVYKRISTIYKSPATDNTNEAYPIADYNSYFAFPLRDGIVTGSFANINKQPVSSVTSGKWSEVLLFLSF